MGSINPIFRVSMLKKCMGDPSLIVPLEGVGNYDSLSYEYVLVDILDRPVHRLRNRYVALVKVLSRKQKV